MALSARLRRRGIRGLGLLGALVLVAALAAGGGLIVFAMSIPFAPTDDTTRTDAIVVLTGGTGRLDEGLNLLAAARAKKLFVSGVYQGVDVQKLLEISQHRPEELSCCIALGHAAGSTEGNALETAAWVREQRFTSIRLVTASYHMPRSLAEFRHEMPDVKIVPNPVFPPQFKRERWWEWRGSAQLVIAEYLKYLAARLRAATEDMLGA
jgi:uncharacterized SAM-binding protein YcdF (DUF218 family)